MGAVQLNYPNFERLREQGRIEKENGQKRMISNRIGLPYLCHNLYTYEKVDSREILPRG
jgi:hypothetical protein